MYFLALLSHHVSYFTCTWSVSLIYNCMSEVSSGDLSCKIQSHMWLSLISVMYLHTVTGTEPGWWMTRLSPCTVELRFIEGTFKFTTDWLELTTQVTLQYLGYSLVCDPKVCKLYIKGCSSIFVTWHNLLQSNVTVWHSKLCPPFNWRAPCKNNVSDLWSKSKFSLRSYDFQRRIWVLITSHLLHSCRDPSIINY